MQLERGECDLEGRIGLPHKGSRRCVNTAGICQPPLLEGARRGPRYATFAVQAVHSVLYHSAVGRVLPRRPAASRRVQAVHTSGRQASNRGEHRRRPRLPGHISRVAPRRGQGSSPSLAGGQSGMAPSQSGALARRSGEPTVDARAGPSVPARRPGPTRRVWTPTPRTEAFPLCGRHHIGSTHGEAGLLGLPLLDVRLGRQAGNRSRKTAVEGRCACSLQSASRLRAVQQQEAREMAGRSE